MSRIAIAFSAVSLALALAAAPAQAADAPAKKGENVVSKPQKARGGGKDENIKSPEIPLNDPSKAGQAAPEKKRGMCEVHVDSRVNLYVKIYVDGDFRGMLGPYGDGYAMAISGPTRLYARADYTDGTYSWWGPRTMSCPSGDTITWTLQGE
jgi:hypothetical protein